MRGVCLCLLVVSLIGMSSLFTACTAITDPNGYKVVSQDDTGEDTAGTGGAITDTNTDTLGDSESDDTEPDTGSTSPGDTETASGDTEPTVSSTDTNSSADTGTQTLDDTESGSLTDTSSQTDSPDETDADTETATLADTATDTDTLNVRDTESAFDTTASSDSGEDSGSAVIDDTATAPDTETGSETAPDTDADTGTGDCVPDCTDRECGDDGCGGYCGPCDTDQHCDDSFHCALGREGDLCAYPIVVDFFPFFDTQDSMNFTNQYNLDPAVCGGLTPESMPGYDMVYQFTPSVTAPYTIQTSGVSTLRLDLALYISTGCEIDATTCYSSYDLIQGGWETFDDILLIAGTTYYLLFDSDQVADDYSALQSYHLRISRSCDTTCDGNQYCGEQGTCLDYPPGQFCRNAIPLELGEQQRGNTLEPRFESRYRIKGNGTNCINTNYLATERGSVAPDKVYSFSPLETGDYDIVLSGVTWNAIFYVVPDDYDPDYCSDLLDNCHPYHAIDRVVQANGNPVPQNGTLTTLLERGQTYFIIVDGNSEGLDYHGYAGPFTIEVNRSAAR